MVLNARHGDKNQIDVLLESFTIYKFFCSFRNRFTIIIS